MTGPGIALDVQTATPAPIGSLVASAASPPEGKINDPHWAGGIRYRGRLCDVGELHDPCDSEASTEVTGPGLIHFQPYVVEVPFVCSTGGFQTAEYEESARTELLVNESRLIEEEFWTGTKATAEAGDFSDNAFLASGSDVTTLGDLRGGAAGDTTSYDIVSAFGGLEAATRDILGGARAMLHVPDLLTSYLSALNLIEREGNLLVTKLGSIVVSGVGYPGTAPNGDAASTTEMWGYGTGIVTLWRSEVVISPDQISEAVNKANNDIAYRASRFAATTVDACGIIGARFNTENTVGIYG